MFFLCYLDYIVAYCLVWIWLFCVWFGFIWFECLLGSFDVYLWGWLTCLGWWFGFGFTGGYCVGCLLCCSVLDRFWLTLFGFVLFVLIVVYSFRMADGLVVISIALRFGLVYVCCFNLFTWF